MRGEGERGKERRETSGGGVERRIEEDGIDCEIGGNWKGQTYSDWIDNGFPLYKSNVEMMDGDALRHMKTYEREIEERTSPFSPILSFVSFSYFISAMGKVHQRSTNVLYRPRGF